MADSTQDFSNGGLSMNLQKLWPSCMRGKDSWTPVWADAPLVVMVADDDHNDYALVEKAFEDARANVDLRWAVNGQDAMDYLLHRGRYESPEASPAPDLILLGLVMPVKDGLETLMEIKGHKGLRKIPLMLLTSTKIREHEDRWLRLGADSFIIKPRRLDEMVAAIKDLHPHHFGIVCLPDAEEPNTLQ
ncbi:MAG: response regulator [Syntrophobacteraceae bacterium]